MSIRTLAAATAIAVTMAVSAATAATLSFVGSNQSQIIKRNDLGLGLNGQTIDFISGDRKSTLNGLSLVGGPARVTFTYLGFEAGNTNFAANADGQMFKNKGRGAASVNQSVSIIQSVDGLIAFSFGTLAPAKAVGEIFNDQGANPTSANYAIGYKMLSSTSYLALFDDIAGGDRDFDDIAIRIDVAAVPLPAAGLMLLAGLGGLVALKRRKSAA